jgi:peptide/nickel transport system ATP-binding protein
VINKRTSIILVTYNLAVAAFLSDKIIVMKDGRIEDVGIPENIVHKSKQEWIKLPVHWMYQYRKVL